MQVKSPHVTSNQIDSSPVTQDKTSQIVGTVINWTVWLSGVSERGSLNLAGCEAVHGAYAFD